MRNVYCIACLGLSLLAAATLHGQANRCVSKPNIIVIMADDLGYGDVSCYGATALQTPCIDQLAAEGLRFTSGYCSASTCTPTRYSLLTGTYAFRRKGTGIAAPNSPAIIQPQTETIASILKRAGYVTAVIGKWHLGLGGQSGPDWNGELKPGPLEIGFDTCFLLPTTNDRVPRVVNTSYSRTTATAAPMACAPGIGSYSVMTKARPAMLPWKPRWPTPRFLRFSCLTWTKTPLKQRT